MSVIISFKAFWMVADKHYTAYYETDLYKLIECENWALRTTNAFGTFLSQRTVKLSFTLNSTWHESRISVNIFNWIIIIIFWSSSIDRMWVFFRSIECGRTFRAIKTQINSKHFNSSPSNFWRAILRISHLNRISKTISIVCDTR